MKLIVPCLALLFGSTLLIGAGLSHHAPRDPGTPYDVKLQALGKNLGLAGCDVALIIDGQVQIVTRTDSEGWVAFEGLRVERFEILFRCPGYFPRRAIFYNFTRRDIVDQLWLKKRIQWSLSGTVRGRDQTIAGARVQLASGADSAQETATDGAGRFVFPALYDTECGFTAQAPGYHCTMIGSSNWEQLDLHFDVELRPESEQAAAPVIRGEEEPAVACQIAGSPRRSCTAERGLAVLSHLVRVEPGADMPRGALARAHVLCPFGAPPRGTLARVDRILTGWTLPYPRGHRGAPSLPFTIGRPKKGGAVGWHGRGHPNPLGPSGARRHSRGRDQTSLGRLPTHRCDS